MKYAVQFVCTYGPSIGYVEFFTPFEYHEELAHKLGCGLEDIYDVTPLEFIPEDY